MTVMNIPRSAPVTPGDVARGPVAEQVDPQTVQQRVDELLAQARDAGDDESVVEAFTRAHQVLLSALDAVEPS